MAPLAQRFATLDEGSMSHRRRLPPTPDMRLSKTGKALGPGSKPAGSGALFLCRARLRSVSARFLNRLQGSLNLADFVFTANTPLTPLTGRKSFGDKALL